MSARRLLDSYRSAGVLRPLDVHLGRALGHIADEHDPLVLLGVAAASRVLGAGHICLELGAFQGQVRDEAIEDESILWPNADEWATALTASRLVRSPGAEERTPLVLDGQRLYLDRYWGYQQRLIAEVQRRVSDESRKRPDRASSVVARVLRPVRRGNLRA